MTGGAAGAGLDAVGAGGAPLAAAPLKAAAPSPAITATTAPTSAVSPAATLISASVPAVIDGTSIDTLSVSISNRLSPGFTASPADLNHFVILPSATVSPSCGIKKSIPSDFRLPAHRDVLRLQKFLQPLVRALEADSGLLHAAERRGGIGDEPAVQADHAEVELLGHAHAAAQVLGVEVRDETVFGVVGALDHLGLVLEGLQRSNRPEDFLVQHLGVVGHVRQHRRRIEIAGAVRPLAAGQDLGALAERVLDQFDHLVAAFGIDQRPQRHAIVEAVAHLQAGHLGGELLGE